MKKIVDVLSVAELDRAFNEAAMSYEEQANDYHAQRVGEQFRRKYPTLELNTAQIDLIDRYVQAMHLPVSVASVEKAYNALREEGSL